MSPIPLLYVAQDLEGTQSGPGVERASASQVRKSKTANAKSCVHTKCLGPPSRARHFLRPCMIYRSGRCQAWQSPFRSVSLLLCPSTRGSPAKPGNQAHLFRGSGNTTMKLLRCISPGYSLKEYRRVSFDAVTVAPRPVQDPTIRQQTAGLTLPSALTNDIGLGW